MFYGGKLSNLRELNGFSRKDLANQLGITEQAIWQYENDSILPRIEVINQLRDFFNVETKYFFSTDYLANKVSEERIAYRAEDRESRKKTKLELTFLNYLDFYIDYFETSLIIPSSTIHTLRMDCIQLVNNSQLGKRELIQKIAEMARTKLALTDNQHLMYVLENSGIYIIEKNLGHSIDAYSTMTTDGRPFIILGTEKKSAVRRNFDLAHELGHLLMHNNIDMEVLTAAELREIEKEAHLFASIFLLPEKEFVNDYQALTRKSNPDYYLDLKKKYLVSIAALEMRAYELGLLTYQENRYFWGQLSKKKYKLFEPLDDELVPVKPGKIRSLFVFVMENKVLELPKVLDEFHILPTFLTKLFNLDLHFFDKYLVQNQHKDYFRNAKIINFSTYRN
jgi:Zn-dependent peptidase ImmA (M78 family)